MRMSTTVARYEASYVATKENKRKIGIHSIPICPSFIL
jgi:hypothetical protein